MDALNMYHILADNIQELEHGVRLSPQDSIASKTLICFLDGNGRFHFGFGYKNGSNLSVVCWENNTKRNRITPKGAFVIAFKEVLTQKTKNGVFIAADFNFQWFNANAQKIVKNELRAFNDLRDRRNELIDKLAGLTVQELDIVNETIDGFGNN